MTYMDLFELESLLSEFKADKIHVELKRETAFPYAFGESSSELTNISVYKGLFIIVIPNDDREFNAIYLRLKKLMNDYDFDNNVLLDYSSKYKSENDNRRNIISLIKVTRGVTTPPIKILCYHDKYSIFSI